MPAPLLGWKKRRNDNRARTHWNHIAALRPLNGFEEYQREWNYVEIDYSGMASNNGLDPANPAFAFSKKLAKHIVHK